MQKICNFRLHNNEKVFSLTDFYYGKPYSRIVTAIGHNEQNSNEVYVYNLTLAPEYIGGMNEARLALRMPTRPKPVHSMRANACPILTRVLETPPLTQGVVLGPEELHRRADALRADAGLRARLIAAFEATRVRRERSPHIEEKIYDGFFGDADHLLMEEFHTVPWEDRIRIIERFGDPRLNELGMRLVYCERPDLLDEAAQQAHSIRIARNLLGLDGVPWLSLTDAIQEADDLLEGRARGPDLEFIQDHRAALERRLAEAMRVIRREKDGA
jgi:exodeoxyribonuclease-1